MTYEQVKDLNLLVPYLELLGYDDIEEMTKSRTGQPPLDDSQVFLGQVSVETVGRDSWAVLPEHCYPLNNDLAFFFFFPSILMAPYSKSGP